MLYTDQGNNVTHGMITTHRARSHGVREAPAILSEPEVTSLWIAFGALNVMEPGVFAGETVFVCATRLRQAPAQAKAENTSAETTLRALMNHLR